MNKKLFCLTFGWVVGCGVDPPQTPKPPDETTNVCDLHSPDIEQSLYSHTSLKWPKNKVSVCFINPDAADKADRLAAEEAVSAAWDQHIELDFLWSSTACTGCEDVRIMIEDDRSRAMLGAWKQTKSVSIPNIWLNLSFYNFWQACRKDRPSMKRCITHISVHEFGHILGFFHEQDRPDTPDWCLGKLDQEDVSSYRGNVMSPYWDENSVMNYCSRSISTSPTDIATAIEIYGPETED